MPTPTKKPYLQSGAGLQIFPHHIQIPGNKNVGTTNRIIREMPMSRYQSFVEAWMLAISVAGESPTATFAQLWIYNTSFREQMSLALEHLDVLEPTEILPSHLEELLMVCRVESEPGDLRPALFRLHADRPDPKKVGELMAAPLTNKNSKPSESLISRFLPIFARTI